MSALQNYETIRLPEPTITDILFQEKRTRFNITGRASLTFVLLFRIPHTVLEYCVAQFNKTIQIQNSRVITGPDNTVIVFIHIEDLCDSVPVINTNKYPNKNSCDQMYDKIRAAGELVDNIYNSLLQIYESSEYYAYY